MNRNRFKGKSSTKVGQLDISMSSTNIKVESSNSSAKKLHMSKTAQKTPSKVPTASTVDTSSPFRAPAPSPKGVTAAQRSATRGPAPSIFENASNVTKRKAKRIIAPSFNDLDKPFFYRILSRCGFTFEPDGDTPHTLDQEQIFFVCMMQEQMEDDPIHSNVDDFMQRFILLHEKDMRLFKKSLSSTKAAEDSEITGEQEPLIHLLLEVQCLQTKLMDFLFGKLIEHVVEEGTHLEGLNEVDWSRLILKQMCNLTFLVDSEAFTKKLLDMFEIANPPIQKLFLAMLPSIIYDDQQEEVTKVLSKLLKEGGELTPQILDALASLTASRDIREGTMENVIAFLKSVHGKFLPQVITFLLMENHFGDDLPQIVQALRRDVDLVPYGINATQQANQASIMVKVVSALRVNLNAIGEVGEVWMNAVAAATTVTMLDLVVMILLYSQGDPEKCKAIQVILRTKSSAGAIKENTLIQLFTHHGRTLGENLESLLDIANYLIQYPDRTAAHHGALWFKVLFLHIEGYQRQQVMYRIIIIVGLSTSLATQNALWVLSELVNNHLSLVLPQAALLMSSDGLLERVESVALDHARKIMDVLCRLAYSGDPNAEALQADISILLKKQLSCPQLITKRKGIVGAVMAVKHIAVDEDELDTSDISLEHVNRARPSNAPSEAGSSMSLPPGHRCHYAQDLIKLVRANTVMYPEINGFFYDELASMVSDQALDHKFLSWLADAVVNIFQDDYTLEIENGTDFSQFKEVKMAPMYGLDGDNNPIVVTLGALVLKEELIFCGRKDSSRNGTLAVVKPYVVCPLFRLVRILKFRVEAGNLEDIDALLGCHLVLPSVIQNLTKGGLVSMVDQLEQRVVLNSLFLAINWLREIVNAFAFSREPDIVEKVIQRVRHIVYLENKLAELLPAFPAEYNPPACQFYADVLPIVRHATKQGKKKKQSRKKKKKVLDSSIHPALDQSDNEVSDEEESEEIEDEGEGQVSDLVPLQAYLREMDMSLFMMLSKQFKIKVTPTQGIDVTPELGPAELVFIMEDLSTKLEHALVGGASSNIKRCRPTFLRIPEGKVGQPISAATPLHFHLDMFPSEKVAKNMAKMTKHMLNKLQLIVDYFQSLEEKNDGVRDGPGADSEYSKQLNRCFLLLLRSLGCTIAWNGFYTPQYASLLLDTLRELASRVDDDAVNILLPGVVSASCQYLSNFGEFILQLPTAAALVSVMQVVASHDSDENSKESPKNKTAISKLCKMFLTREWPPVPRGSISAGPLTAELVQALMDTNKVRLIAALKLLKVIDDASDQLKGKNAPGHIENMPTVNKTTLPAVYKVLAANVVTGAREAEADPDQVTQTQGVSKLDRKFQAWSQVIEALQRMVAVAKFHETTPLLTALFKHSQSALKLFTDRGMPTMDKCMRHHPTEVQNLLKNLQKVTRFLQNRTNSLGLVQLVPNMKFVLNKLVHRVYSMLAINNCTQAFWIGNLKNRNLQGEEIPSQMDEEESHEEEEKEDDDEKIASKRKKIRTNSTQKADTSKTTQKSNKSPAQKNRAGPSQAASRKRVHSSPEAGPSGITQKSQRGPTQKKKRIEPTQTQKSLKTSQNVKKSCKSQTLQKKKTIKHKLTSTQKSTYRSSSPPFPF